MIERNRRITRESSLETEDPYNNLKKGKGNNKTTRGYSVGNGRP